MKRPNTGHLKTQKTTGQALVEFSLILPILLLVVLGIVDFGRILFMFSGASGSIRDATRQVTLAGTVSGTPRFMACNNINSLAGDFLLAGNSVQDLAILYFDTTDNTDSPFPAGTTNATIATDLENLDITTPATLLTADYDCDGSADASSTPAGLDDPDNSGLSNGDLVVILMQVEIDFITPFASQLFQSLEVQFRSQRTIVTALELLTVATDLDGDGLDDLWEFQQFGCVLENTEDAGANVVYLQPDDSLMMNISASPGWAYVELPYSNTAGSVDNPVPTTVKDTASGYDIFTPSPGDCARDNIPESVLDDVANPLNPLDPNGYDCGAVVDGSYQDCRILATDLFTALDDPDGDNCVNGCEEANSISPITSDSDGDGLTDLYEIALGTDPSDDDTDGDNLLDGDEHCEGTVDTSVTPNLCSTSPGTYYGTDPLLTDTDTDGLNDDAEVGYTTNPTVGDTDGDGLLDGFEINGFDLPNLIINGVADPRFGVVTSAIVGGDDTDMDGISDFDELNGYDVTYNVSGVLTTFTVYTHPLLPDTDGDGLNDGAERNLLDPTRVSDPTYTDTDGDSLNDYDETILYQTYADNTSSDDDQCLIDVDPGNPNAVAGATNLSDFDEMAGAQAVAAGNNPDGDLLGNGTARVNANDSDSDGDGLTDCDEVYIYNTNPYAADSDGGGRDDFYEVQDANFCLDPNNASDDNQFCNTTDSDLDGMADGWEEVYFPGDLTQLTATGDYDNDNCDDVCEFTGGSDPTNPDTDGDLIRDGYEIGTSATDSDSDNDGLTDGEESKNTISNECVDEPFNTNVCYATNPNNPDTDGDGINDGPEVDGTSNTAFALQPTDPTDPDSDNDGLTDGQEVTAYVPSFQVRTAASSGSLVSYNNSPIQTNPNDSDTDDDGLTDSNERDTLVHNLDPTNADTDGDGIKDGTVDGVHIGELGDDFNAGVFGFGTKANLHDTDLDGLSDSQEIYPSNPPASYTAVSAGGGAAGTIVINYVDTSGNNQTTTLVLQNVTTTGFNASTMLNPLASDSDTDGLTDFEEIYPTSPNGVTNPLDCDTDGDDTNCTLSLNDEEETNDGDATTNPLDGSPPGPPPAPDVDGDGLVDTDGNGTEDVGTSDTDIDTDDDGLTDVVENDDLPYTAPTSPTGDIPFSYVYRNTSGSNQTVTSTLVSGTSSDSDLDGIMDSFEIFWNNQSSSLLDTSNGFVSFAASNAATPGSASCPWLTNGNLPGSPYTAGQPLDPNNRDTDGDNFWDIYECRDEGAGTASRALNPFNGQDTGAATALTTINDTALTNAMYLATQGDYAGAISALGATATVDGSGRVLINFERTRRGTITPNTTGEASAGLTVDGTTYCGNSWDSGALVTNACAIWVNTTPNTVEKANGNGNGSADNSVQMYITPYALFDFVYEERNSGSSQINSVIDTP